MAELVRSLPTEIKDKIEIREWDMRTKEGVQRYRELRARMLPSLAINQNLIYEAMIPPQEELIEKILSVLREGGNNGRSD